MKPPAGGQFLSGVIEGFYGVPWTRPERLELLAWMKAWGLNTYVYGPKDDVHHRTLWREPYPADEAAELKSLLEACRQHGVRFAYAMGPGLDIRFSSESDRSALRGRIGQMLDLGCRDFCLLFDDIPDVMDPGDRQRWGSFAAAQCDVVNETFRWARERAPDVRFLFCPTPYCGRMALRGLGGSDYLAIVGRDLDPAIGVFWTGPEIISEEITVGHVRELEALLQRPVVIWDNLQANDYDGHRFFCGPYSGRPPALRTAVAGILLNPNTEFPLNFVPLRTFAEYLRTGETWNPRAAYQRAIAEWLPAFATVATPVSREDLELLGDCYYLPYEDGAGAVELWRVTRRLLGSPREAWGGDRDVFERLSVRLRDCCVRMTELRNRPLFHALNRRIWELREEMDLLSRFVRHRSDPTLDTVPFESDFHRPQTYRGGLVARLQGLLQAYSDGSFSPSPEADAGSHSGDCKNSP
ncbi:MAG: protein O-GlcNAcase [Verrucomicrobiota bacterium]